ncbi:hypothetical protein LV779_12250 [Streptomyces thinghirensis]|nr:hypothetical protein [Streptomyces thinghirensis]
MHTYDTARHQWRYDIGGYARDNPNSPRTRGSVRLPALRPRRHLPLRRGQRSADTGEVDVYHLEEWAGLGTRHGVQHYADSAPSSSASPTPPTGATTTSSPRRTRRRLHARQRRLRRAFLALDLTCKIRTEPYTPDRHALSVGFAPTGATWSRRG